MSRDTLLDVQGLRSGYRQTQVLHGVNLVVNEGEILSIIGHNGAGKTTTLRAIMGLNPVFGGEIRVRGTSVAGSPVNELVKAGLSLVPEGRSLFGTLTVKENMDLALSASPVPCPPERVVEIETLFPIVAERKRQIAESLSGGEQQQLSIAMALVPSPKLLLLDEPSLGLAPVIVDRVMEAIAQVRDEMGTSVVLVEQNVVRAARAADRLLVMKLGRIVAELDPTQIKDMEQLWDYF